MLLFASLAVLPVYVISVTLTLTIAWFNFPRFLVPPYLRHEPGALSRRRRKA